ncbi:MAG: SixA phosphatase family protein, partial [Vicinamibacteria bacterium]
PDSVGRLLLVAHNPGMEDLVEILSGKREPFPTAALAVFEVDIDGWKKLELGVPTRLVRIYRPKELA